MKRSEIFTGYIGRITGVWTCKCGSSIMTSAKNRLVCAGCGRKIRIKMGLDRATGRDWTARSRP